MKKLLLALSVTLSLSGCSNTPSQEASQSGYQSQQLSRSSWSADSKPSGFSPTNNAANPVRFTQEINRLVTNLADQLVDNIISTPQNDYPIAITSFVNLDDLNNTNWLGHTLSESFIHELTVRKIPVLDYKTTGHLSVTQDGDYVFTRDWTKLKKELPVNRILTGTMSRNGEGVMLNLRIIDVASGFVESTAQGIVPNHLLVGSTNSMGPLSGQGRYIYRTEGMQSSNLKTLSITN